MDILKELLPSALQHQCIQLQVLNWSEDAIARAINRQCLDALTQIQEAVCSPMDDFFCLDQIVDILSRIGLDTGTRHDFG